MYKVLSTPELLVAMLEYLPMRELLFAQFVSHGFCALIKDTLSLQQNLFMKPKAFKPSPGGYIRQGTEINQLLQERFPSWFTLWTWLGHGRCELWMKNKHEAFAELERRLQSLAALTRPGASWRKMLVAQPPVKQIRIMSTWPDRLGQDDRGSASYSTGLLDCSQKLPFGVTMAILYDRAQSNFQHKGHEFGIFWRTYNQSDLISPFVSANEAMDFRSEPLPQFLVNWTKKPVVVQRIDLVECFGDAWYPGSVTDEGNHEDYRSGDFEQICVKWDGHQLGIDDDRYGKEEDTSVSTCDTLVGRVEWHSFGDSYCGGKWFSNRVGGGRSEG